MVFLYYSLIPYCVPGISLTLFHFKFHNHLKSLYNFPSYFIYLFLKNYLFVYLATLGLNCDAMDLPSLSWHWESLVVAHGPGTGQ